MGDLNTFIEKTSWRGFTFEYRNMVDEGIGVGFEVGQGAWYNDEGYKTYTDGTQSLSGYQYRYVSTVPILVDLNYYLKPGEKVNPFVGLGVGTEFSRTDVDMGLYYQEINTWAFALKGELGLIYQMNPGTGLIISGKYYSGFKTEELDQTRNYVGLNVGLVWQY